MVEEAEVGVDEDDAVLVTSIHHQAVVGGPCWADDVFHATLKGKVKIVVMKKEPRD